MKMSVRFLTTPYTLTFTLPNIRIVLLSMTVSPRGNKDYYHEIVKCGAVPFPLICAIVMRTLKLDPSSNAVVRRERDPRAFVIEFNLVSSAGVCT